MLEILGTPEIEFPVAREHVDDGKIVLFWDYKNGVVIKKAPNSYPVGHILTEWDSPCNNTESWIPVDIKITG